MVSSDPAERPSSSEVVSLPIVCPSTEKSKVHTVLYSVTKVTASLTCWIHCAAEIVMPIVAILILYMYIADSHPKNL